MRSSRGADPRAGLERALAGLPVALRPGEPLAGHTTFNIGGPARFLLEVGSEPALAAALAACRELGLRWWLLGRGSNVLISDQGLDGVVLRLVGEFEALAVAGGRVEAGAGAGLDDIAGVAEAAGLSGFAFLAGIPGTLGGGLRTNAGAFGGWLADLLEELRVMDPDGATRTLARDELRSGYRRAVYDGAAVALRAGLRGAAGPVAETCAEIRRRRREKQPAGCSAGSFFKNPPGEAAGRLIERCGFKGRRVGGAQVSERHANFIINTGGARFADVYALAQAVKAGVEAQTGVLLEEEVRVLPGDGEGEQ